MGKLTDFVMANKVHELSAEEKLKVIRKENQRKMEEVRQRLRERERERENELRKIEQEIFAEPPKELPAGTITGFLSSDILDD